jgi:hypothetical protein
MAIAYQRLRRGSTTTSGRPSLSHDLTEDKSSKSLSSTKVLVFKGKCSETFKSTIEDCVEDCILEFSGQTSIYVPKFEQTSLLPAENRSQSNIVTNDSLKTPILSSIRMQHRRDSITNSIPISNVRCQSSNTFSLPTLAIAATSATRIRHQAGLHKFSLIENISEETNNMQSVPLAITTVTSNEPESNYSTLTSEQITSNTLNVDCQSKSSVRPITVSHRDRRKNYRLSDLVMRGPEHFAHIFNLSRLSNSTCSTKGKSHSSMKSKQNKASDDYDKFEQIKQDLFHRYLWTQKPQVSCRIRSMSAYTRHSTSTV